MEILLKKAELVMWQARKEAHRLRLDGLRERLISEQEDVERMENGGLFTQLRNLGRFESNLEREVEEASMAQAELEQVETILKETDKEIDRLQREVTAKPWSETEETAFDEERKRLVDWIDGMELARRTAAENNICIEYCRTALQELQDGTYDDAQLSAFGERVNGLYRLTGDFLRSVGTVRIVQGIKAKTWRRTYYVNGGKTVLFLHEGKPVREVRAHSFDFSHLKNNIAIEEALLWTMFDLENLKLLFAELIEEMAGERENLLGWSR